MTSFLGEYDPAVDALERAEALFLDARRRTEEFLATLGHEMRSPLSALSTALQVWSMAKEDPAQMEELRSIMERQVRQLVHLSDDLLDVARIAQGRLELHREPVGLEELIEAACEQVRPFIDGRGHALTVRMPAEPLVVYGDPSRLLQVFANLIQNAAKFTNRNGSLCVTVEPQDGMAVVRVRDNGPGIEEHMLPSIFEPFTQVAETRGLENDGVGIGLRLVKTIVELHGGAVVARSEGLGCGSEFTVQLPVTKDAPGNQQPATEQPAATRHEGNGNGNGQRPRADRIDVVEDGHAG
ncbi:MAG TPA: HAMP domain-containing sensor histidine kinase [Planctomycetaceae bacterium]|nr:HAMP domain-containing sensor histidine kinase [Planctomycetaceae bacterium]